MLTVHDLVCNTQDSQAQKCTDVAGQTGRVGTQATQKAQLACIMSLLESASMSPMQARSLSLLDQSSPANSVNT